MNLKIPRLSGLITISTDPKNAHEVELTNLEHMEAELASYGDVDAREEIITDYTKKPRPSYMGP